MAKYSNSKQPQSRLKSTSGTAGDATRSGSEDFLRAWDTGNKSGSQTGKRCRHATPSLTSNEFDYFSNLILNQAGINIERDKITLLENRLRTRVKFRLHNLIDFHEKNSPDFQCHFSPECFVLFPQGHR